MTVFVARDSESQVVMLSVRAEGSGMLGDMFVDVHPGEIAFGKTYDEWTAVDLGSAEVP